MYLLLNLSHCVKSYGHFSQILAFFAMPAHQIWSCHVIQDANFKIFLLFPNYTFNIRKRSKISSGQALYFRSYQPKTSRGVGNTHPPCLSQGSEFDMKYHVLHDFIASTPFEERSSDHFKDLHKLELLRNIDISLKSFLGGVMK